MDLYYMPMSAPCRAVRMTAAAVGCELNLKFLDLMAGEQNAPSFLKVNPQHVIPTLVDNGFVLWESRAICVYLVEKYGNSSLFPKDLKTRAVINQRLYFDMGTLYAKFADYYYPQIFHQQPADPEKFKAMENALGFFNKFLETSKYAAGNELTIADIPLVSTISSYDISAGFDLSSYPNIIRWYELCKETVPGYAINQAGAEEFKKYFQ